ncbi:Cyclic di-GMP phosphodiesterase response regulator RpfG [Hartmannibacter diazotrophicus]|uniref:Cyclic di-GMP phosphodiesterase response regulator RpfG n=1 Tax=Hartmannibacter diazotrophicus TaxID=1482074 RepID=A0A2C9D2M3_9HYPH|nr:HD-GYP domain-containing protein [Hartmannibacter diazotrophicus]SON54516.1 Cyclic di-GMP phosphodiesterase response regulator RpfG [Hartmannibacter diazotrophicus]
MQTLRLAELLGALSQALDLTEGQPAGHCVRCAYIGTRLGRELGLGGPVLADLYYTLLLKDLGCSSNAARICQLYLVDDLAFKADFKQIDGSLPQVLRFVLSHTGLKAGLSERFRAILHIFQNGGTIARELIETRCHRGAEIAAKMHFSASVCEGILSLDEHYDGSGKPEGLSGDQIPMFSQIALLAQVADVFQVAAGPQAAIREVSGRSGTWFSPSLVAAFCRLAEDEAFWSELTSDELESLVLALEPAVVERLVDEDYLDDIAEGFANVIDSKSPYTSNHSERVTLFADMIAEEMGISAERRRWLRRVALLHDIGKLGVSNGILDKPGKLDDIEWTEMREHAAMSRTILKRIPAFAELAEVAGAHHERLDGKGYPDGLSGDEICLETRIITTADIFDALTAERPYRAAMPVSKAFAIMTDMLDTAIDPGCFDALQRAVGRLEMAA